jgi:geranylgeranyl diphosphate synthase type I
MPGSSNANAVHARMLKACGATARDESLVFKAISHHLCAGGSHVRANFSLGASRALGVDQADAGILAAVCELLHNASLIHDDLIDRAPMRRGFASVWAQFGDSTAVCAGDLMLSAAYTLVSEIHRVDLLPNLVRLVHRCTRDVILGQDAEQNGSPNGLHEYEQVAIGKSASLLSLPFELSLLISDNEMFVAKAQRASESFAVAYQMLDDLNDYAEDRRNGSLNAVSVVMDTYSIDYVSAVALVRQRAKILIEHSIDEASGLPKAAGAPMIRHAEVMQQALCEVTQTTENALEPSSYGG